MCCGLNFVPPQNLHVKALTNCGSPRKLIQKGSGGGVETSLKVRAIIFGLQKNDSHTCLIHNY